MVKITKIAQDITAEVATQKSLGLAKQLADELNVQKDNFIANMSHELRTPLNAIVGFSDLLFHQEQDSKKLQYLSAIKSASDSLLYLVNDILDLSKIESGIIQFDKTSFSVKDVVKDVFNVLGLKAKQKGISFKFYISNAVPKYVIGDKNRLVQVLNNLLNNAIKFTQEGNVMLFVDAIRTQSNELQLHFSVEDTGIGIPKDKLKTIFNRFTQAESSTTRLYGGTGLGLNISQLIVERQGGTLGVESEYNKGSKFWFVLPFDEIDEENQTFEIFENLSVDYYSAKILICEDNELNRILMDSIFKETDFEIEFAENGLQALDLVKEKSFDLILMDLHMPFLDGYETVKLIRQELQLSMPIIALTANSLIKEKEVCLALGMNDYLAKPFKTNELLTKIVSLLEVEGKQKTISLEALEEYSGGNIAFQKQMIELFLETSEKEIQKMNAFLNQESLKEASQVVHKLKSSLGILGVDLALAQDFENELIQANDSKKIESCKTVFLEQLQQIRKELIQILKSE
ncbi:ATP-binding protein [Flavobacterium haoranii]|uniref:ATP-binding protein n=1 Tax=Flavobacterium haoranii TaxID=683124 RepID=UPI00093560B5|nr:ATP-binding protein [Flavobacterium haoranii]